MRRSHSELAILSSWDQSVFVHSRSSTDGFDEESSPPNSFQVRHEAESVAVGGFFSPFSLRDFATLDSIARVFSGLTRFGAKERPYTSRTLEAK